MNGSIEIDRLTLDELAGVVSLYPWFAVARKKLCLKTVMPDDDFTIDAQCAEAGMYMCDKSLLYDSLRERRNTDYSDKDVKEILLSYTKPRNIRAGAGDFFSQEDYDSVPQAEYFSFKNVGNGGSRDSADSAADESFSDFCTETLAEIFVEQGYPAQAKRIYSKLILQNPEKSAYFASLIEKIDQITNN